MTFKKYSSILQRGHAFEHSLQDATTVRLLPETVKIKIYRGIILLVIILGLSPTGECTVHILRMYGTHIENVRYTYWECTVHILRTYGTHIENVRYTYWECTVHILRMYGTHIEKVRYTYWECKVHILRMYGTHIENVQEQDSENIYIKG